MARKVAQVFSSTALIAALSQVESGWLDNGRHGGPYELVRTSTGGTYVFEVDWSNNASTVIGTDTIVANPGEITLFPSNGRWGRMRIKNTHGTVAFSAHNTKVYRDAAGGS